MIGTFVGAAAVTYYVIPSSIATRVIGLIANLMGVVFPLVSDLHSRGEKRETFRALSEGE